MSRCVSHSLCRHSLTLAILQALTLPALLVLETPVALANCVTTASSTVCSPTAPDPWASTVGTGNNAAEDNRSVDIQAGASIVVGNANAISLRDNAVISVGSGSTVSATATSTGGLFGTGGNTVETRTNGQITVAQGGQILAQGTQGSAEAINFQGAGNTVTNSGIIRATNSVAIWSQNTSGLNTIINTETGVIQAPGTVIGGSGNGALDFTNRGQVIGNINLAGGNDILRIYTGSTITGNFSGGAGNDAIFLSGTGDSTLPGNFVGFESLTKNDSGRWTLSGSITGVTVATVQQGVLALTGNNAQYTGQVIVDPGGTLEARAQSLPPTVTNNGLVRFAQTDDGTYGGAVTGSGALEKTGAGMLTLAGITSVAGATTLREGTLQVNSLLETSGINMVGDTVLRLDNTVQAQGGGAANVTGDSGAQQIVVGANGRVTGSVSQGDGDDQLTVNGGTIVGQVQQGNGRDDFLMTGGTIDSLFQGDGTDTFRMSGGRIIGAFEDGDRAWMSDGRIGRVNMKLEKNLWDQSGGVVDGNVVTGFDDDTIIISGTAFIGGNVSVSGGRDNVTITGGTVAGQLLLSTGNDTLTWNGGGVVKGAIDMGPDDDVAVLANLTVANMGAVPLFNGGTGNDSLTFDNTKTAGIARFQNWETVAAVNGSELTFDGDLVLGDSATATGTFTIDGSSAVLAGGGSHAVNAFNAGTLASVINAGRIELTNAGSPGDAFTVAGNYRGEGGSVLLKTVLGADNSASDRLVIEGGVASGRTGLGITNVGGGGAETLVDGILVVQAQNGGSTRNDAFSLLSAVSAGAYDYYLYKGGQSAGTRENWYLRSTLPDPAPGPEPEPIPAPGPSPQGGGSIPMPPPIVPPGEGVSPPTPGATPAEPNDEGVVPLYRPETPTYAVLPPILRDTSLVSLGTFHERQGEQRLLYNQGAARTAWGRLVGQSSELHWKGDARPGFDGDVQGLQAGLDLWAGNRDDHRNQVGVFVGRTRAQGKAIGTAGGWDNVQVGQTRLDDKHVGLYWTLTGSAGGYVDVVAMQSRYDGHARSMRGLGIELDGSGTSVSLEAGKPLLQFGQSAWWLEPQVQVIWQRTSLDDQRDAVSVVSFDNDNAWTGRVGLRLAADYQLADNGWQPYFKLNYWHGRSGEDRIRFDDDVIINSQRSRAMEAGVGVVGRFNRTISAYAVADYTRELGGDRNEKRRIIEGNIGLRADW